MIDCAAAVDVKLNGLSVVVSMEYLMTLKDFFLDSLPPPTTPSASAPAPQPGQHTHVHTSRSLIPLYSLAVWLMMFVASVKLLCIFEPRLYCDGLSSFLLLFIL